MPLVADDDAHELYALSAGCRNLAGAIVRSNVVTADIAAINENRCREENQIGNE